MRPWLVHGAVLILLLPRIAFGQDDAPAIPKWAVEGVVAAIERPSSDEIGVSIEALNFPYFADIIEKSDSSERALLEERLIQVLHHQPELDGIFFAAADALERLDPANVPSVIAPEIVEKLKVTLNKEQVNFVIIKIGLLNKSGKLTDILIDILKHGASGEASVAATALANRMSGPDKGKVLIALAEQVKSGEDPVADSAAPALETIGVDTQLDIVVPALLYRVSNGREYQAAAAVHVLAKIALGSQSAAVIRTLAEKARPSPGGQLQCAALGALAKIDAPNWGRSGVQGLLSLLAGDSATARSAATELGNLDLGDQTEAVIAKLAERARSLDSAVAPAAAAALGEISTRKQSGTIIAALVDEVGSGNELVASNASAALGRLGRGIQSKAVVSALINRIGHGSSSSASNAAKALGEIGLGDQSDAVVKALIAKEKVSDFDFDPEGIAASALKQIVAADVSNEALSTLLQWMTKPPDPDGAVMAAEVLSRMGGRHEAEAVRRALLTCANGDRPELIPICLEALGREDPIQFRDLISSKLLIAISRTADLSHDENLFRLLLQQNNPITSQAWLLESLSYKGFINAIAPQIHFADRQRALFYLMSGGAELAVLGKRLGHPQAAAATLKEASAAAPILKAMHALWPGTADLALLREEIARQAVEIVESVCTGAVPSANGSPMEALPSWGQSLLATIIGSGPGRCEAEEFSKQARAIASDLDQSHYQESDEIKNILAADVKANPLTVSALRFVLSTIGYAMLWAIVMLTFPRSRFVQAVIFFSPSIRKFSSLYVSEIFPLIPFARKRLLSPFRAMLGPPQGTDSAVAHDDWFPDIEVTEQGSDKRVRIVDALPVIRGLTVLEGASGLGKTAYLVRLVRNRKRLVAFVHAGEEGGDVEQAIAARLPEGVMRDKDFLGSLIYAGTLDICIDGLNEVSAGARGNVLAFAKKMSKANILIATQPLRWEVPQGARVLRLRPLRLDQTEAFLQSREKTLPDNATVRGADYVAGIRAFLAKRSGSAKSRSERDAIDRVLSNPMDLISVALIIGRGGEPDLLNLQEAAFQQAGDKYAELNQGAKFPLTAFVEHVYSRRVDPTGADKDRLVLDDPEFQRECELLADYRLLLSQTEQDAEGKTRHIWIFRHDKILDFFLYKALTSDAIGRKTREDRVIAHIDDPRFRGTYQLLASRSPLDFAEWLRARFADHAAETRDHTLSDQLWQTVRQRISDTEATAGDGHELVMDDRSG